MVIVSKRFVSILYVWNWKTVILQYTKTFSNSNESVHVEVALRYVLYKFDIKIILLRISSYWFQNAATFFDQDNV